MNPWLMRVQMPSQRNLAVCPTLQTRGGDIELSCSGPKSVFCSIYIEELKQNSCCDVIHRKDSGFHGKFAVTIFSMDRDAGLKVPRMSSSVISAMLVG